MRLRVTLTGLLLLTFVTAGCGPIDDHLVTARSGGHEIGLAYYVPANATLEFLISAYADVEVGTPAVLMLSGPQQWTCNVTFDASDGRAGFTNGNAGHDRVLASPWFGFALFGPEGAWTLTVEIPSAGATFSHTWQLGTSGRQAPDYLYQPDWRCSQVASTLLQQQRFVQSYLSALHRLLYGIAAPTAMLFMLDHVNQAKLAGDKEPDAASRAADYRSAAAGLTSMAQLASSDPRVTPKDARTIAGYATSAAALLLQTGLA